MTRVFYEDGVLRGWCFTRRVFCEVCCEDVL